jgi:D-alanine-D-alanine ligase
MYGEDGRLQSILEAIKMPYTGSGVLASAVAMDKVATKRFLISANISTPKCLMYNKRFDNDMAKIEKEIIATFGVPVVIKAADQGSSIGVEIVKEEADVAAALENTFKYSDLVLVEECINGKELTCGVMEVEGELKALPIVMIAPHSGSYDFHSKYTKGATDYLVPAPLSEEVTAYVQGLAIETYKVLGLSGVARIDVMLDAENIGYVLEANTIPGMTATSLVPKEAAAVGISFQDLCEMILLSAK